MKGRYPTQGDLTLWSDGSSTLSSALPVGLLTGVSSNNVLTRKHILASASRKTQAHTPWVFSYLLLCSSLQPPGCWSGDSSVAGLCFCSPAPFLPLVPHARALWEVWPAAVQFSGSVFRCFHVSFIFPADASSQAAWRFFPVHTDEPQGLEHTCCSSSEVPSPMEKQNKLQMPSFLV